MDIGIMCSEIPGDLPKIGDEGGPADFRDRGLRYVIDELKEDKTLAPMAIMYILKLPWSSEPLDKPHLAIMHDHSGENGERSLEEETAAKKFFAKTVAEFSVFSSSPAMLLVHRAWAVRHGDHWHVEGVSETSPGAAQVITATFVMQDDPKAISVWFMDPTETPLKWAGFWMRGSEH